MTSAMTMNWSVWPSVRVDLGPERLQRHERLAELVREYVLQPVEVADEIGLFRCSWMMMWWIVLGGIRGFAAEKSDRVPGVGDEHEAEKRREEQYGDAVEDPPDDVREHGFRPCGRIEAGIRARPSGERGSRFIRQLD